MNRSEIYGSKRKILDTFKYLVGVKKTPNITVTRLMEEAGLTRQIFYKYFIDIEDLAFADFKEFWAVAQSEWINGFDYRLNCRLSFEYMQRNQPFYAALAKSTGPNSFREQFKELCRNIAVDYLGKRNITEEMDFVLDYYAEGVSNMVMNWAQSGMDLSPEVMADYLYSSIPHTLFPYFSKTGE